MLVIYDDIQNLISGCMPNILIDITLTKILSLFGSYIYIYKRSTLSDSYKSR